MSANEEGMIRFSLTLPVDPSKVLGPLNALNCIALQYTVRVVKHYLFYFFVSTGVTYFYVIFIDIYILDMTNIVFS